MPPPEPRPDSPSPPDDAGRAFPAAAPGAFALLGGARPKDDTPPERPAPAPPAAPRAATPEPVPDDPPAPLQDLLRLERPPRRPDPRPAGGSGTQTAVALLVGAVSIAVLVVGAYRILFDPRDRPELRAALDRAEVAE